MKLGGERGRLIRQRAVEDVTRALHDDHEGRVATGLALGPAGKWEDCHECGRLARIAVAAIAGPEPREERQPVGLADTLAKAVKRA